MSECDRPSIKRVYKSLEQDILRLAFQYYGPQYPDGHGWGVWIIRTEEGHKADLRVYATPGTLNNEVVVASGSWAEDVTLALIMLLGRVLDDGPESEFEISSYVCEAQASVFALTVVSCEISEDEGEARSAGEGKVNEEANMEDNDGAGAEEGAEEEKVLTD